jgi:hypothetical protein
MANKAAVFFIESFQASVLGPGFIKRQSVLEDTLQEFERHRPGNEAGGGETLRYVGL